GRMDFFPLSYPNLLTIPLCWATYLAVTTERSRYFLLTALLMAASYHVFPSGQTGFLIPLGMLGWWVLNDWKFARRCWRTLSVIPIGAVLWFIGFSVTGFLAYGKWRWVDPFNLNEGKTLWSIGIGTSDLFGRVLFIIGRVTDNILWLLESVFVRNHWPYHTAPIHGIFDYPAAYLPAVVTVFLVIGFVLLLLHPRRRVANLLLIWVVVALLPGILSTEAAARRVGCVFPALIAVAALTASSGFQIIYFLVGRYFNIACKLAVCGTTLIMLFILQGSYYFCQIPSPPPSIEMVRAIRPHLTPGALVVGNIEKEYFTDSEISYMLLDDLNRGDNPPVWVVPKLQDWPAFAIWPSPDFNDYYYKFTVLHKRIPDLQSITDWNKVTFIIQDVAENKAKIALIQDLYPESPVIFEEPAENPWYNFVVIDVDTETIRKIGTPIVRVIGEIEHLPDNPRDWWDGISADVVHESAKEESVDSEMILSAGLWVDAQCWESFRVEGGGEIVEISVDGVPATFERFVPLTSGFHSFDVRLGAPSDFPIRLFAKTHTQKEFQRMQPGRLVSPRVCEIAVLTPQIIMPYTGYQPPVEVASIESGFGKDSSISPSGRIAVLGVFADSWKIQILRPDGSKLSEWSHPFELEGRGKEYWFSFAGDERIVFSDSPTILIYNATGELLSEFRLPLGWNEAIDIAANEAGEIFVTYPNKHCVLHYSIEGEDLGPLTPEPSEYKTDWRPWKVSVPHEGAVAVLDPVGNIHVFETVGSSPGTREWTRVFCPQVEGYMLQFQARKDGWIFLRYIQKAEFRVIDNEGRRRIAEQPDYDLSTLLTNQCSQVLGFDKNESLYIWHEGSRKILKLETRAPQSP
ncbi:MAG: hypothetical protein ABIH23_35235, partial [bacterium]